MGQAVNLQSPGWEEAYEKGFQALRDGRLLEAENRLQEALAFCNHKALEQMTCNSLGECLLKQKHYSDAIQWYERSLRLCVEISGSFDDSKYYDQKVENETRERLQQARDLHMKYGDTLA